MRFIAVFLTITVSIIIPTIGFSQQDVKIAILYPEVSRPYSIVFEQIIEGIKNHTGVSVSKYGITDNNRPEEFEIWLQNQKSDSLIALGRHGSELIQKIQPSVSTIIGGVLHTSDPINNKLPGISLTPDPNLLFERLKLFSPRIKRIYVIYNPENYTWLIKEAQNAADKWGFVLVAKPVSGLRDSALTHKDIIEKSESSKDSIWLLQDPTTVGTESILPYILKEAWGKKLLIFSSSPEHVARGVLFSLYPDYTNLGKDLADLAVTISKDKTKDYGGLKSLSSTRIAVNTRTASHLGLRIPFEVQREFDLVFPRR